MAHYDLLFKGGTVVHPYGEALADVAVSGGKIAALGSFPPSSAQTVVECRGLHLLPGVVDTQVHFREPGLDHKEDLETGSRAAVAGGVVGVFEMPNTLPPTTSQEALEDKMSRAAGRMYCHWAFYIGATWQNADSLGYLETLPGCCGVKVFMGSSTGSLLMEEEEGLNRVLAQIERRAAFHSEDESRLRARLNERMAGKPASHATWRDEQAALLSTQRLLRSARTYGKKVHVLHVSTAEEIALLEDHRDLASVEVTPHHLLLSAEEAYERLGTLVQMNPPIREKRHQDALWAALIAGNVDVLGSDHAPHTLEEKAKAYPFSPSGMTGVQTLVPMMLNAVNEGRLSLQRLVSLTSERPAELFGSVGKGKIAPGYDADLSIVDLNRKEIITNAWIESRSRWTPYDGITVKGWPVGTIVNGQIAMWQGDIFPEKRGKPFVFDWSGKEHGG